MCMAADGRAVSMPLAMTSCFGSNELPHTTPLLPSPHCAQDLTKRKLQKVNEGEHDVVSRALPGDRNGGGRSATMPCC